MSGKSYTRLSETAVLMATVCLICESAFAQKDQAKQHRQTPPTASLGAAPNAQLKEFSEQEFQKLSKEALSKSSGKAGPKILNPKAAQRRLDAARETVPLNLIPSSWVKLDPTVAGFTPVSIEYTSPVGSGPVASGRAVLVYRYMSKRFSPNFDYYDFSRLAPGWTIDSMQLFTYDLAPCPGVVTYKESSGTWRAEWDQVKPNNIIVAWSPTTCSGFSPPPPAPPVNMYTNRTVSAYALKVWVNGPRGTSPSGLKVSATFAAF